jgi:hypothetical protein
MGILNSIKNFGSSVVSGIGAAFTSTPVRAPSLTTPAIATGSGFSRVLDSAISRISNFINPRQQIAPNATPVYVFDDSKVGGDGKIFGVSQKILLVVAAGLVGFLVFKRLK